jgi:hypothetical protein
MAARECVRGFCRLLCRFEVSLAELRRRPIAEKREQRGIDVEVFTARLHFLQQTVLGKDLQIY